MSEPNITLIIHSKTATAQLREVIDHFDPVNDRETAKELYRELRRLSCELERRHGFGQLKKVA